MSVLGHIWKPKQKEWSCWAYMGWDSWGRGSNVGSLTSTIKLYERRFPIDLTLEKFKCLLIYTTVTIGSKWGFFLYFSRLHSWEGSGNETISCLEDRHGWFTVLDNWSLDVAMLIWPKKYSISTVLSSLLFASLYCRTSRCYCRCSFLWRVDQ